MDHFGIDVHKKESQICILAERIEHRIRSSWCLHVISWNLHGLPWVQWDDALNGSHVYSFLSAQAST